LAVPSPIGAHVFVTKDLTVLTVLIGNAKVSEHTARLLILAIYGVPWLIKDLNTWG